jgi:hypothetical protein
LKNERASAMIVAAAFSLLTEAHPMDDLAAQRMPADHYRRQASRVWRLAGDATTPAVKQHLRDLAAQFERLAEGVAHEEAAYVAAYPTRAPPGTWRQRREG